MKIDRLLGITIFLLNRNIVKAKILAEKFEVSVRTIQRDIETLNLAGIPVVSTYGTEGGYEILDGFKVDKQIVSSEDYLFILTALKGLDSAYDNKKLDETLEKLASASSNKNIHQKMFLDFNVLREGNDTNEYIQIIDAAIEEKRIIDFEYTNSENHKSVKNVEPLATVYKWYSWYLFGYCLSKKNYCLFKLTRMRDVIKTNKVFLNIHEDAEILLDKQQNEDLRVYLDIKLFCKADIKIQAEEYLKGNIIESYENGDFIMALHLPKNERMWFSIMLGFGNKIKVLEPKELENKITEAAKEIINNYSEL